MLAGQTSLKANLLSMKEASTRLSAMNLSESARELPHGMRHSST
jgi:hypothetical protein